MSNAEFSLDTSTMVVEFNCSVWTAKKLDRAVTEEVNGDKKAIKGAGRFNKNLLAGRPELVEIQSVVGDARTYVYANTAPWSDAGQRWIPIARLLTVDKRLSEYRDAFNTKVDAFCDIYPTLITAQAMALGDMFNRNEYPPVAEIRRKFSFGFDFIPLPSTKDFRVAIASEAQEELRERLTKAMDARVQRAVQDVQDKLVEHLQRMSTRLVTAYDAKGEEIRPKFHDTLVTGALELCDLVRDFNVNGDKALADARMRLEAALTGVTATQLKEDPDKRQDVKAEVDSILSKFNFT